MDQISKVVKSLHKTSEEYFFKPMANLDFLVTQNLHHGEINTRPARSNGLWCFALLPIVLVVNSLLYDVSHAYKLAACLSVGLSIYGIFFNILMSVTHLMLTEGSGGGCLVSGAIASALVYTVVKEGAGPELDMFDEMKSAPMNPANEKLNQLIAERDRLVEHDNPNEERLQQLNQEIRSILLNCGT